MRSEVGSAPAKYHRHATYHLPGYQSLTPRHTVHVQVVLNAEHLLQFHMARDNLDSSLQYPTRYLAEDNTTFAIDIRLNRYVAQTQVWRYFRAVPTYYFMSASSTTVSFKNAVFRVASKSTVRRHRGSPRVRAYSMQDWLDARERAGDSVLKDFNGMPYLVPIGMASTQVRVFLYI